jgi:FlaA1/EpsC-like NDP-sugar epimerase
MMVGITILAGVNFVMGLFKTFTACFIDLLLLNQILWFVITARFAISRMSSPYLGADVLVMLFMHAFLSVSFLAIFFYRGVYSKERYSVGNALISGLIASMLFMVAVFFVKSMAFSRIAFAISTLIIILVLIAWREMLPKLVHRFRRLIFSTGSVVILGNDEVALALIKNVETDASAQINGVLWPVKEQHPGELVGYPILGTIDNIRDVLSGGRVDLLLIATAQPWYSYVIEALATVRVKHLTIQWVPPELFNRTGEKLPDVIPVRDFSV